MKTFFLFTLVDVSLTPTLDHDVPELERLTNVLQNGGGLVFIARTNQIGLGQNADRTVALRVNLDQ